MQTVKNELSIKIPKTEWVNMSCKGHIPQDVTIASSYVRFFHFAFWSF